MPKIASQQRRGNLQQQLLVWINATLILLTIVALSYDYITQHRILTSNFHASMKQAANHISLALEQSQSMEDATGTLREYCKVMRGHDDPYHEISLISDIGNIVVSSKNGSMSRKKIHDFSIPKALDWETLQKNGEEYTSLTMPFEKTWGNKEFQGAILYVENNKSIHLLLNRLFWNRAISLIIIIIILSLITLCILKVKVLTPLDQIYVQSYAASTGDYETWNVPDPGNEIGDIQKMFNFMLKKIKKHEIDFAKKERHSAIVETISQIYHSIGKHIAVIKNASQQFSSDHGTKQKIALPSIVIQNECDSIYDNLSNLIELFDLEEQYDEPKNEGDQK